MIRHLKYSSIIIFYTFSLLLSSCGTEEHNPVGVWEELGNPENKIVLQQEDNIEIASRQKGSFRWYIFNKARPNFYIGDDSNNLEILSADSLEIFNKEMRQFKKVYTRTNSKVEGFWLLNLLMPRETVAEILGKPDSISKEHKMEEWFYGEQKVIRFGKKGINSFTEKNMLNPDLQSIALGDHYKELIQKIGSPYLLQNTEFIDSTIFHYFYYNGENTKFTLQDSMVNIITLDVPRFQKEFAKLIGSQALVLEFDDKEIQNDGIIVEEKGKIVDRLSISFQHDHQRGYLRCFGKKYHLIFRLYDDNTFQGIYSRPIKRRRHKADNLEIKTIKDMNFAIHPDLLNQNKLAGRISLIINEPHSKNTVISGTFIIDIPDQER